MSLSDKKGTRERTEGDGKSSQEPSRSKSPFRPTPTGDEPLPSNAAQQLVGVDWRTGAGPSSSTQDITNPLGKRKRLASGETEQTHSPNPEEKRRPEKRTRLEIGSDDELKRISLGDIRLALDVYKQRPDADRKAMAAVRDIEQYVNFSSRKNQENEESFKHAWRTLGETENEAIKELMNKIIENMINAKKILYDTKPESFRQSYSQLDAAARIEAPGRSTTPDGEPPRGSLDFATMHRTSGVSRTTDFAPEYGTLQAEWERYKEWGLVGKGNEIRVLEPLDPSFDCHFLTFFDGRTPPSDKYASDENFPARYVEEEFSLLGSRDDYRNDSSLYKDLADRLRDRPNHYIAVYRVDGAVIPLHTSPIKGVYQKENGEYSIMLWGKWGGGPTLTHDIENVPLHYKDGKDVKW